MQDTNNQNLGIEDGTKVLAKSIENLFHEIIAENFPNLEKDIDIHVPGAFRTSLLHSTTKSQEYRIKKEY